MSAAADSWDDIPFDTFHPSVEYASDNALLPPYFRFFELSIFKKTREFGAGAGATRRTVVGFTWTEDEVTTIHARGRGGSKELNVVNLCAVSAGNSVSAERLAYLPGIICKRSNV